MSPQHASRILALSTLVALGCSSRPRDSASGYAGYGAESVDPATLAKYAPPALPDALRSRIERQLDIRSPAPHVLNETGDTLFLQWSVTGTNQVWRSSRKEPFPVQLTAGEDPTSAVALTRDGRFLVLSRDRKGEENPGLYLMRAEGGELREIQHKKGVQTFYQGLSHDGRYLWYSSNEIKNDSRALYRYDLRGGRSELMFSEPGLWSVADFRENGDFLLSRTKGSQMNEISLWSSETRKLTPLLGHDEAEEYDVAFAPKAGRYFVCTKKFGEFRRVYTWEGKGHSAEHFRPVTPAREFDVDSFYLDDKRRRLLVTWNDGGLYRLQAFDASSLAEISVPRVPREIADDFLHAFWGRTTRNARYTVVAFETSKAPRRTFILDWKTGRLESWLRPSTPEIDTRAFTRAELQSYPARDGTLIPIFVRWPSKCPKPGSPQPPCPVIVDFHGGPEAQSIPYFSPYHELFLERGFVYVEPNVRGSDGYGKSWLDSDNGPKRLKVITDIEDAALYIRKNWGSGDHAPRIGVTGGSYGGYSTLYAMTRYAGAYDAGVAVVGMSDLITFLQNTAPYRRQLRITEYGDPERDREALTELSPITHVDKTRGPVLIIQGVSDPRVPAGEAIQMHKIMSSKGLASELILFGDEGHGVTKRPNRVHLIGHTLRFFETHLKTPN